MSTIAICVNPMSGRDVRRLAAKATNITPETKRDIVARIAIGADAAGVKHIFAADEPFRIASGALSWLPLSAKVHILKTPITNTALDTETALAAFLEAGVDTVVSLGGDGTNRALVRAALSLGAHDLNLIPLSAGTNNAFPVLAEPTIAGVVAGFAAQGRLNDFRQRCKVIHVTLSDGSMDVGLIDATLLTGDSTGNLLPFDTKKLSGLLLTRADPAVVGMATIGGFVEIVTADDDHGLLIKMGAGGQRIGTPVSPGLFEWVDIASVKKVALGEAVSMADEGVLALDGDRDHLVDIDRPATVSIRRDGPWVLDTNEAMRHTIRAGLLKEPLRIVRD